MPTESETRINFADNLRWYSKRSGITQIEIATKLAVSTATVSDWFSGKKYPRPEKAQKLADMLGVRVSDLQKSKSERGVPQSVLPPVTTADLEVIKKYHTLNAYGKDIVDHVLDAPMYHAEPERIRFAARGGASGTMSREEVEKIKAQPEIDDV